MEGCSKQNISFIGGEMGRVSWAASEWAKSTLSVDCDSVVPEVVEFNVPEEKGACICLV